ncbi:MAG: hypothetical protein Fur0041_15990 [Bacteroidia bacterium]
MRKATMKTPITLVFTIMILVASCSYRHTGNSTQNVNQTTSTTTSTTSTTQGGQTTIVTNTTTSTTTTTTGNTSVTDSVNTSVIIPQDTGNETCRLVISFISRGSGIDLKAKDDFIKWLNEHPKKPQYEESTWGREGEVNVCLKLEEFSTRERDIFIRDARTILSGNELVIIQENVPCAKRR